VTDNPDGAPTLGTCCQKCGGYYPDPSRHEPWCPLFRPPSEPTEDRDAPEDGKAARHFTNWFLSQPDTLRRAFVRSVYPDAFAALPARPSEGLPQQHGGQDCDPSEAAAIRQFEVEAIVAAFDVVVEETGSHILGPTTVQVLVAAGEYERAARIIHGRLRPPEPQPPTGSAPLPDNRTDVRG